MTIKLQLSLGLLLGAFALSACDFTAPGVPKTDTPKYKAPDIDLKVGQDVDDFLKGLKLDEGGQPGTIQLKGVIGKDPRISVSQTPGKNLKGEVSPLLDTAKPVLTSQAEAVTLQAEDDKTYINFGCDQIEPEWIAGLREKKSTVEKGLQRASATKILICKSVDLDQVATQFVAKEILLVDADIFLRSPMQFVYLTTEHLELVGKNSLRSVAPSGEGYILPGASIDVSVSESLAGDGTLAVSAIGGDNLKKETAK
jgi:hypothetical protein